MLRVLEVCGYVCVCGCVYVCRVTPCDFAGCAASAEVEIDRDKNIVFFYKII